MDIVRVLWMPLLERYLGSDFRTKLAQMEEVQWWDRGKIEQLQWRKLKALLEHAYANVPFYRKRFDEAGIKPEDIKSPDDMTKIPILTKSDIRQNMDSLIARGYSKESMIRNSTGGSTGSNIIFYYEWNCKDYKTAAYWRSSRWVGLDFGVKHVMLWGAQMDIKQAKKLKGRIRELLFRERTLSAYNMSREDMIRYKAFIERFRPRVITGYVSALCVFAKFLLEDGPLRHKPESIIASAESMSPQQRQLIEEGFGVPVYGRYGCREFGTVAHECKERGGYHIISDRVYLELDKTAKPIDEQGSLPILITDLDNYGMPFIRYSIEDLGIAGKKEQCPCGRGFPLLENISGRVFDVVVTPQGKILAGTYWTILTRSVPGIVDFQVLQEALDKITLFVTTDGALTQEGINSIKERVARDCGRDLKFEIEVVEKIEKPPSGKHRFIVSKIPEVVERFIRGEEG